VIVVAVRILYYEPMEEMAARDRRELEAESGAGRNAVPDADPGGHPPAG
jgi:hypothetical protein